MMPSIGGLVAQIDARGSRYVAAGMARGWMPVPTDDRQSDLLHLTIDGERVASGRVDYTGRVLLAGNGLADRHAFTLELPRQEWNREVRFGLVAEDGAPIGDGEIDLEVDASGDGILIRLNENLRAEASRVPSLVRRNRPGVAHFVFQRAFCRDVFADHNLLLLAARAAAEVHDLPAAEILITRAMQDLPQTYAMLSTAGKVLLKLGRHAEAKALFEQAIRLDPAAFDGRNARIKAIIGEEDWHAALRESHLLRRKVAPDSPSFAELSGTIAWLYLNLSKPETALTEAEQALLVRPLNTRLMQMKGDALVRLSRYDEAIDIYREALKHEPKAPLVRKRIATALMLSDEFAEAADQDQGRMLTPTFARLNNVPEGLPLWRGELNPDGKLLVWAEVNFGVGQNLLHGSILPDLVALGLDVVLEVETRLVPVFAAAFPQIEVVEQVRPGEARGDWIAQVACHLPIGSLVRYFRRTRTDYVSSQPFLRNDPARTAALRAELDRASGGKRMLVGFSWTSNNLYVGDEKSVPIEQLLAALDLPDVGLVNLQYGDHADAVARASGATGVPVLEAQGIDRTNDLLGMCDLVAAMDVVVCIGHTTAHLAGGLGIPNLVLVPSSPFAHWLGDGETCVWYPHTRVLRQTPQERGDWAGVLTTASEYLGCLVLGIALPEIVGDPLVAARQSPGVDSRANFCRNALELAMAGYEYRQINEIIAEIYARHSGNAELLRLVGDSQFRSGRFELALSAYRAAIAAGGDRVELTVRMVQVMLECNELELAASFLRRMFAEHPGLIESRHDLVVLEAQILLCQDKVVDSVSRLRPLLERDPANHEAAVTIANAYSARGEFEKAHRVLAQTVKLTDDPAVTSALGIAIGRSGITEWGAKAIGQARTYGPDPLGTFWLAQFDKDKVQRDPDLYRASEVTLPKSAAERVTVFVCMDTNYCQLYLPSLASSIAANSPETNLHVHLVDPDEDALARLKAVEKMLGPDRFSHGFEAPELKNFDLEQRKTYFASIRFVRLAELMRAAPGTYFVMDADNIVRGDLGIARSLTRRADVLIRNRFSIEPHLAVAACGILLADSDATHDFMDRTAGYILDAFYTRHVAWYLDQIALTYALKGQPSEPRLALKVEQLSTTLLDWDFAQESLVWTGKGKRRLKNKRYLLEYNHYVDAFNKVELQPAN
jgi:tetratricopeptide (TPR) repeat protein